MLRAIGRVLLVAVSKSIHETMGTAPVPVFLGLLAVVVKATLEVRRDGWRLMIQRWKSDALLFTLITISTWFCAVGYWTVRVIYDDHVRSVSFVRALQQERTALTSQVQSLQRQAAASAAYPPPQNLATKAASSPKRLERPQISESKAMRAERDEEAIKSITVEARLTVTLREGADLPPPEIPYMALSGGQALLEGAAGTFTLDFVSPAIFRRQENNRMVIVSRYAARAGSDVLNRPLKVFQNLATANVPVQTVAFGKSFDTATLFELTISVNGRDPWYYAYQLGNVSLKPLRDEGKSPEFRIPLGGLYAALSR